MDRNSATGLFLISALLLVYLFFFSPKKPDEKAAGKTPPATTAATANTPATPAAPVSALAPEAALDTTAGPARDLHLTNANLDVTLSTRGGRVAGRAPAQVQDFLREAARLVRCQNAPAWTPDSGPWMAKPSSFRI